MSLCVGSRPSPRPPVRILHTILQTFQSPMTLEKRDIAVGAICANLV